MRKEHGRFLIIMTVLTGLSFAAGAYIVAEQFRDPSGLAYIQPLLPAWFPYLEIMGIVLGAISLIGIWFWKKWAVYLFFAIEIFALAFPFFVKVSLESPITGAIFSIMGLGVWFWAIYRKWEFFD